MVLGKDGLERLRNASVIIFGIGGVGGYAVEALARSGVGRLALVDNDVVSLTNLNRQLFALHSTVGQYKVDVAAQRIQDIDPSIQVEVYKTFYLPETAEQFDFSQYDYVVDAIDTVTGKLSLIEQAKVANTRIICAMGTGNKIDPTALTVADISKTSGCHLARIMRKECGKRGFRDVKVVYSTELAKEPQKEEPQEPIPEGRRSIPGSTAFVPAAAGLLLAAEVVKDLLNE